MNLIKIFTTALLIASTLLPIKVNAQKFKKSEEPFTASNGKTYHIGDSIIITSPADFSNRYVCYKVGNKLQESQVAIRESVLEKGEMVDIRYTKCAIKQFRHYENEGTYAVVDKLFNWAININKGIEMGEIASDKLIELYNKPQSFSKEKAFLATLSETIDNNDVKEYLYRFYRNEYKQNYQDEFAFNSLISSKKKELAAKAKQYDGNKKFFAYINQEFGTYDFDSSSYPIVWDGNYIHLMDDTTEGIMAKDINDERIDFSDIAIYIDNTEEFASFSFPQERAKYLVNHRKASNGKIDRSLYMGVQFEIESIASEEWLKNHAVKDMTKKILICNLKRVDLFEDKACEANYLFTIEI
ncbi:DUF4852 domain-containing protein [Plebeiibacterium sediminum]|uniref:DUF4852 domain-containing protein n=1 Tax=Plebeiibacterium sediminum TaxID=2992112 RepID=A0AAE3M6V0_9BACT|nr:DUF4852 domain-containing protein [Plebeiobacterium sediminum]MCW3787992.1 DUF4852 domain-containing protein [Plebeiobacterium sediminum]